MRSTPIVPHRLISLATVLLLVAPPASPSGVVPLPLPLATVVRRASTVVEGRSLGMRELRVRAPISETQLPPGGRTQLTFTVRQLGIRVDELLEGDATRVRKGAELWLTDPVGYQLGLMAEQAEAGYVAAEVYQPSAHLDVETPGTPLIAFIETSADRAERGGKVAGLLDAWWQVVQDAFEAPARRREIQRLLRSGARARPGPAPR